MSSLSTEATSKCYSVLSTASTFLVLAWVTVLLRVYVRGYLIKSFGWDDWLMLVTLASFTIESSIVILKMWIAIHHGVTPMSRVEMLFQYVLAEVAVYLCVSIFLKLSLAFFFLRIVVERAHRKVITISVIIYTVFTSGFLVGSVFQCGTPFDFYQKQLAKRCMPWTVLLPFIYVHGLLNAIIDWTFVVIPMLVIKRSKMPARAKITISMVLAIGVMGSVASLVRLAYVEGLYPLEDNFFGKASNIAIASNVEPGLGIIAASLATLHPLLKEIAMSWRKLQSSLRSHDKEESQQDTGSEPPALELQAVPQKQCKEFAQYGYCETSDRIKTHDTTTQMTSQGHRTTIPHTIKLTDLPRRVSRLGFALFESQELSSFKEENYQHAPPEMVSRRDEWIDLEDAKQIWIDRTQDGDGVFRIEPHLLLPECNDFDG